MFGFLKKIFAKEAKEEVDWDALYEQVLPKVEKYFQKAIWLDKSEQISASTFGGMPNVPEDSFSWPQVNGKPLSFLAQLVLSEVNKDQYIDFLPTKGTLLFFYDIEEQTWGFDPKDKDHFSVIYLPDEYPSIEQLNKPDNLGDEWVVERRFIEPKFISILPDLENTPVESVELTDLECDAYIDRRTKVFGDNPMHQLGGPPTPVQSNFMQNECQMASSGHYCGDSNAYDSVDSEKLDEESKDWSLLLQFDTDDEMNVMWGDCGMLYFWVKKEEARVGNFSNCWLVLQCC